MTTSKINTNMVGGGGILQVVTSFTGAVVTATTVQKNDDTIPQNDEGDQVLTCSITPKSATSKLLVEVDMQVSPSAALQIIASLFRDSATGSFAAAQLHASDNAHLRRINFRGIVDSNATTSTTFKVRLGPATSGTLTLNGTGGSRLLGGVYTSGITITEIAT